ncbi:conserved hypothetical protein [Gammaproteobacteria bacterium]
MNANLHDQDFYAWTQQQLEIMRLGDLSKVDLENWMDEIESMGASERRELESRIIVLLQHLLKWQFQPNQRSGGWLGTIDEQRTQLEILLRQSPSLKRLYPESVVLAYPKARRKAAWETGATLQSLPESCPYSLNEILDEEFLPD